MNRCDIKDIEGEAGIVASVIMNPELTFYSENLKPNYFSDEQNAYIYYAVSELAKRGVKKIDAYNITNMLNMKEATKKATDKLSISDLNNLIDVARLIARDSVEDYMVLVESVSNAAFRRETHDKLVECERLCFNSSEKNIEEKIYSVLDNVMLEFSSTSNVPQYKDVVDDLWQEIKDRQKNGLCGIPFKFPTLNQYATLEAGELFLFAADKKIGKSIILLNCAVDLMKAGKSVLYIDSELSSRLFTCRLISHLTQIDFARVKSGRYTAEEEQRINQSIQWLKSRLFTHIYMPAFDLQSIYTTIKKVKHTQGIDVLIIDYFKGSSEGDAFASYAELGRFVDLIKNKVCGDMNIVGLGAVQATETGKIADSAKIARSASTIALIQKKTKEEMEADGTECGNRKLRVIVNRNGQQMYEDQYIDLAFNGNIISYEEAKQHTPVEPY